MTIIVSILLAAASVSWATTDAATAQKNLAQESAALARSQKDPTGCGEVHDRYDVGHPNREAMCDAPHQYLVHDLKNNVETANAQIKLSTEQLKHAACDLAIPQTLEAAQEEPASCAGRRVTLFSSQADLKQAKFCQKAEAPAYAFCQHEVKCNGLLHDYAGAKLVSDFECQHGKPGCAADRDQTNKLLKQRQDLGCPDQPI